MMAVDLVLVHLVAVVVPVVLVVMAVGLDLMVQEMVVLEHLVCMLMDQRIQ
jgi:hypothetical protein